MTIFEESVEQARDLIAMGRTPFAAAWESAHQFCQTSDGCLQWMYDILAKLEA